MNTKDLLNKLEKPKQTGPETYQARCPAHQDKTPSLAIKEDRDRILLYWHAGCSPEHVVAALGLTMKDLFFESGLTRRRKEIVVAYPLELDQKLRQKQRGNPDDEN